MFPKDFGPAGMSNQEMEMISKSPRFRYGMSPWARFETERTGFGRLYRKQARYPSFLPLMFSGDHGVEGEPYLWPNETDGEFTYLTWKAEKATAMKELGLKAHHVPHPWTSLLEKSLNKQTVAHGALYFWPHAITNEMKPQVELDQILQEIRSLPTDYYPLTICLTSHDINMGIHKDLRPLGYPLISMGDLCDQSFPIRFIKNVRKFKYVMSDNLSSAAYYALALGIPHSYLGRGRVAYKVATGSKSTDVQYELLMNPYSENNEDWSKIHEFSLRREKKVPQEIIDASWRFLGIDSPITPSEFTKIVWKELFLNWKKAVFLWFGPLQRGKKTQNS